MGVTEGDFSIDVDVILGNCTIRCCCGPKYEGRKTGGAP